MKRAQTVLVVGSGISGLLHIKLAKSNGAKRVIATDITDFRLKAAIKAGADVAINAGEYTVDKLRAANSGALADLVIICASAQSAFEQGLRSVERGGTALIFSAAGKDALLPVPVNDIFWRSEVTVMSTYAGSPHDHVESMEKIRSRKVGVYDMITHRFPLKDAVAGFRLVAQARESVKVIIEPQK